MAARSFAIPAEAAAYARSARWWLLCRRPAAAAGPAAEVVDADLVALLPGPAPNPVAGEGGEAAAGGCRWWVLTNSDLQRTGMLIGSRVAREVFRSAVSRFAAAPPPPGPHPALGLPALSDVWAEGPWEYELALVNPVAGQDYCPVEGGPPGGAAVPSRWGTHEWVLGRRQRPLLEGGGVAPAGAHAPPFQWLHVSSVLLKHTRTPIGSSLSSMVYKQRCRRLLAAFRAGRAPEPCALLPEAPLALVEEWADAGDDFFIALVHPVAEPRRVSRGRQAVAKTGRRAGAGAAAAAAAANDAEPGGIGDDPDPAPVERRPTTVEALRAWLGIPGPVEPVVVTHQWFLGRRRREAAPNLLEVALGAPVAEEASAAGVPSPPLPPAIEWLPVTSDALLQPGLLIGSETSRSVYHKRCHRIRAAFQAGRAPEPCALLPGSPPALVEEWTDAGEDFFIALVRPVAEPRQARRVREVEWASPADEGAPKGGAATPAPQDGKRNNARAISSLRKWLGAGEADPPSRDLPDAWGYHQWVFGYRPGAASDDDAAPGEVDVEPAPAPYEWIAVSAAALQLPGLLIGSAAAKSVYKNRCRRLLAVFREDGHAAPAPCALLPGAPPALFEEWTDKGRALCVAVVRPVAEPQVAGGKAHSRAAITGGAQGDIPRALGRDAAPVFRAWLEQRGLSGPGKGSSAPAASASGSDDSDSDDDSSSSSSGGGGFVGLPEPAKSPLPADAGGAVLAAGCEPGGGTDADEGLIFAI